jgi:hypothetical protein
MKRGPYKEGYEGIQVNIRTKRLKSGKCQVKFSVKGFVQEDYYGYMLVEADSTLKEVVCEIKARVAEIGDLGTYRQRHLFSIRRGRRPDEGFMVFRKPSTKTSI